MTHNSFELSERMGDGAASGVLAALLALGFCDFSALAGDGAPPAVLELKGIVRDFRERTDPAGHADFEVTPTAGFGHYAGNVSPDLGPDDQPVFTGNGFKVKRPWRDAQGRPICHLLFDKSRGDRAGEKGAADTGGIESSAGFNQWFDDVAGVNLSKALTLKLVRQPDGRYIFDDTTDPTYAPLSGFFPIEHQLFGNPGGTPNRNFHFTYELHTQFKYDASLPQVFRFVGDDDVWVFVNGKLVIDLGGVHAATEEFVDLKRLGLTSGETYSLDFFFAERHRTQSNFRIETTLVLQSRELPPVTAAFD